MESFVQRRNPTVLFTKDKVEPADVAKDSSDFKKVLDDLMPLQVNRFEIKKGDWVKEKTGTKGMTVVATTQTGADTDAYAEVRCRFKQEDGSEAELNFKESDLVPLD